MNHPSHYLKSKTTRIFEKGIPEGLQLNSPMALTQIKEPLLSISLWQLGSDFCDFLEILNPDQV